MRRHVRLARKPGEGDVASKGCNDLKAVGVCGQRTAWLTVPSGRVNHGGCRRLESRVAAYSNEGKFCVWGRDEISCTEEL